VVEGEEQAVIPLRQRHQPGPHARMLEEVERPAQILLCQSECRRLALSGGQSA
jgi:hypothetical protein